MRWFPLILILVFIAPTLLDYGLNLDTSALAAEQTNPIADYWRSVRKGEQGYSAVKGQESGILIQFQSYGESWRQLRNGPLSFLGAGFLALTIFALGVFYFWRGQVKLTASKTGQTVQRWSTFERLLHWYSAILFLVLGDYRLEPAVWPFRAHPAVGKKCVFHLCRRCQTFA